MNKKLTLNELTSDNGRIFDAVTCKDQSCDKCAFKNNVTCLTHPSYCSEISRSDDRDVIWVERKS